MCAVDYADLPKRRRRQLVKAELLLHLARTVERWGREMTGREPGTAPFGEWPADDPLVELCRTYELTPVELAEVCRELGDEIESRAIRAGYDDHLEPRSV